MFNVAGLGNPGEEYKNTRHNTGRIILEWLAKANDFSNWEVNNKAKALISAGKIGKTKAQFIMPDNFMNNSGKSLPYFVKSKKDLNQMVVIYDDLDLPIGKIKISYNKSSGGHRGLESIIRAFKSEEFPRVRVGISPATPSGKIKKPSGERAVEKQILGKFKDAELATLKKLSKKIGEALAMIATEGREKAMSIFNQ
ncbi:MAG TPA: aminoacyl-tRNA hydrolase [Candidatus Paceibacterota bacterium]|nr:aminoacyl-tRNA hydrolase [Candidatus Paceibacterota bacterium]